MRYLTLPLVLLIGCTAQTASTPAGAPRPAVMARSSPHGEAISNLNHRVNTSNDEAQRHFNDGLTLCYAFNHDEAIRAFEKALVADPKLAMAHWGIAYALGPNYNVAVDAEREKKAYEHLQTAKELAKAGPQEEKDYIDTLATRFSNDEKPDLNKLANDYAKAARELAKKYPDDLDAATLAADAMMNLRPWKLYSKQYEAVEGTEEIVSTLESVLKRDPDHIGANHLYIHAVEASTRPHRALESAARLPGLAPDCGHLVHMPSHIYARVGDHESAATSNEAAVSVDREYFKKHPEGKRGMYEMMYFPHNIHFCAYAQAWQGNYGEAKKWAAELYEKAAPHVEHMPMLEGFTAVPIGIDVKFRRWNDILKSQSPDEKKMPITTTMWHYARAMAFAGHGDLDQARSEREKMMALKKTIPDDAMYGMLNKAHHVLDIAEHMLDGKIAAQQKKFGEAEKHLRRAVALEDDLPYMETPDWLSRTRESLGGVLLMAGKPADAEKVFREDLSRQPRNARSLFGLWQSLKSQNKAYDAEQVERQFKTAWKNADSKVEL